MNEVKELTTAGKWKVGISYSAKMPMDLQQVKAAGIDCIELTWQSLDIFDATVKEKCDNVIQAARSLGIEVWSIHIPYGTEWDPSSLDEAVREQVIRSVTRVLQYAQEWGIHTAVFHPSWEPIADAERPLRLETCRETLELLAVEAAARGIVLAVECLPRTCLGNSAEEMEYLLPDHPGLGICCDVNHLFKEAPEAFIRRLGSRIRTTHISDNDGIDERHWMPGKGIIQWAEVLSALEDAGYGNVFLYEIVNPAPRQVIENYAMLTGKREL
ncbi:sugar phosphate isomerase/epimerase family protein [Paenibacillus mendelii]|uniref:Sugar phosphate isomerase/epimerase family protein n=1 Tax=Paenibacillus mendelii TaxID=206163 RepID=A0ABV6JCM1_9BACL|nr:sugar phosphate isomerase/epimerase family protein [Paenibacillus mendelii]MCQ6561637.1 sugar phosphate isomerase/epimerase [Paenibacillus mendelii]